jgi:hypothetical protein
MISLTAPQLLTIGCVLVVTSFLLPRDPQKLHTTLRKVVFGLAKVVRLVGIAALIAGAIIILLSVFFTSDLTDQTLKDLNDGIERYHHWLEWSWIVLAASCLSLLACIWFGLAEITAARARAAGRIIKATSTAKILAGFLACCTFIGAGAEGRITEREAETEATAQKLSSLQLILFKHVEREIEQEVISETIHDASTQSSLVQQTINTFQVVAPFLPNRPTIVPGSYGESTHESSTQPTAPDVTLKQIAKVEDELKDEPRDESPEGVLVEDFVHLAYDNTVSDAMKQYLLHIGNPIISEMVSAFLDPMFGESIEGWIRDQARRVMTDRFDRASSEAQVREGTRSARSKVVQDIASAQATDDSNENDLGDPRWARVRDVLQRAVMVGLPRKKPEVQEEARVMMTRYSHVWESVAALVQDPQSRTDYPEKIFAVYLSKNADYAALWGYAVISVTPPEYKEELSESAQQSGPPREVEKLLRDLVRMKYSGDPSAVKSMQKFDPNSELTMASTRSDYARVWFAYHGPYPQDGYVFYEAKTGKASREEASSYYQSAEVSRNVDTYCPNNKDTAAP